MPLVITSIFLPYIVSVAYGAEILVIPGHTGASHVKGMYPIAETLSENGHNVTVLQLISSGVSKTKASSNSKVHDYFLMVPTDPEDALRLPRNILWGYSPIAGPSFVFAWSFSALVCRTVLDNEKVKEEMYSIVRRRRFDLLFVDDVYTPCGMLVAQEAKRLWNASIIDFGTTILMPQSQEVRGIPINKALYPSVLKLTSGSYDHTSFKQRVHNFVDHLAFYVMETVLDYTIPRRLGMPRSPSTAPSLFASHSDLLIASLSPMLEFTKPKSNDVIELDTDCPAKQALPEDYQKFVDDPSSKGTIVFAMGHRCNWDDAPVGMADAFLDAFSRFPDYRIVWQYVSKMPKPKASPNVILKAWIPQAALLYHEKTKVFITHVGGKSLRETICGGVPAVTMPLFSEQYRNAAIANKRKIASFLDKTAITVDTVFQAVTTILNDTSYQRNARALQQQLKDTILKPMELGQFWSEFLLRHSSGSLKKYFRIKNATNFMSFDSADLSISVLAVIVGLVVVVS